MNKNNKVLLYLASLWTLMASAQAKADGFNYFDYKTMRPLGKIQDMVLSEGNEMFALKTTGAKIANTEYPIWVGNSSNLSSAFSSSWMTNAAPSCAFVGLNLYVAPKAPTNHLYHVNVGNGQLPTLRSMEPLNLVDSQGNPKTMNAPYLYSTTNNLYAIEDTANGVDVHALALTNNNNQSSLSVNKSISLNGSIRKGQIKDIVSKNVNGNDCLYILTTNDNQMVVDGTPSANLWLVNPNGNSGQGIGEDITPNEWKPTYIGGNYSFTPWFDRTTSIAVHGDKLLTANANYTIDNPSSREYQQLGILFTIDENNDGKLKDPKIYHQSDTYRTSAIGSDQETYYAEAIDDPEQGTSMDPSLDKYFFSLEQTKDENGNIQQEAPVNAVPWTDPEHYFYRSHSRKGAPVHKFTTRSGGEIFAISPDCIYRMRSK